jgi:hypothetical protein
VTFPAGLGIGSPHREGTQTTTSPDKRATVVLPTTRYILLRWRAFGEIDTDYGEKIFKNQLEEMINTPPREEIKGGPL